MKKHNSEIEQNPFSLSIGDLMSALLLVFALLLSGAMLKLQKAQVKLVAEQERLENIPKQYENTCLAIYTELDSVFADDMEKWGAEIDSTTLSIRFLKENIMFDNNETALKADFKAILDEFFPRYLAIIRQYTDHITEIRIEGHTSSTGEYFHNMELSQDRARNVLIYCTTTNSLAYKKLITDKVTANGYSYSRTLKNKQGEEDETRSRRVEFRIITDSEQQIQNILQAIQ